MKEIIKLILFIPSFWLGLWVGAKVPPLFINGLVGLQWLTIATIALLPIIFLGKTRVKSILWFVAIIFCLILLHASITYHDQQNIPVRRGMTREQVRSLLGKSEETQSKRDYARFPGVTFSSFKISNVCEIFLYEDGVLYVYIDNEGKVEHVFKGET